MAGLIDAASMDETKRAATAYACRAWVVACCGFAGGGGLGDGGGGCPPMQLQAWPSHVYLQARVHARGESTQRTQSVSTHHQTEECAWWREREHPPADGRAGSLRTVVAAPAVVVGATGVVERPAPFAVDRRRQTRRRCRIRRRRRGQGWMWRGAGAIVAPAAVVSMAEVARRAEGTVCAWECNVARASAREGALASRYKERVRTREGWLTRLACADRRRARRAAPGVHGCGWKC
jgi:hypothetical protein